MCYQIIQSMQFIELNQQICIYLERIACSADEVQKCNLSAQLDSQSHLFLAPLFSNSDCNWEGIRERERTNARGREQR